MAAAEPNTTVAGKPDRGRWPMVGRKLRPTLAASILLAGGVWGMISLGGGPVGEAAIHSRPLRVAVPPFAHAEEPLPVDGQVAALAIAGTVATLDFVEVVRFHDMAEALEEGVWTATARDTAWTGMLTEFDVDLVIRGTLLGSSSSSGAVAVDVFDVRSGHMVGPTMVGTAGQVGPEGWQDIADRVATRLVAAYQPPSTANRQHGMEPNPPPLAAYLALSDAVAAFASGDTEEAERQARVALNLDPGFTGAAIELAIQLANQRRYEAADSIARELRRAAPPMATEDQARLRWLEAALSGDRLGRARDAETAPLGLSSRFQRAYELSNVGRLRASLTILSEDPEHGLPEFRERELWLATVNHHRLGEHDREFAVASTYRAEFPELAQAWRLQARALAASGASAKLESLHRAAERSALPFLDAELAYEAGTELLVHGRAREGMRWLTRALERLGHPQDGGERTVRLYADVLYAAGRWEEARGAFERLLTEGHDPVRIKGSLAVIHARLGEPERAKAIAAELEADHPADAGNRTMWQARIAAALGEHDRVADLLDLASARGVARPGWVHAYPEWRYLADRSPVDRWLKPSGHGFD